MNVKETIAKLALIGLDGKFQGTGHADYERVYVIQGTVTLGRITIFHGAYSHIKWYSGIIEAYDIDQRRPTLAWDMLLQTGQVLTDEMWSSIKLQAQRIQEDEIRKLETWRIENPPGVDHLGRVKRRRSIKGPSLMKCIHQVMNLSGAY
uniref:Uncharacterized protein n=1 Tax=Klebsiella phage vB_Kpn2-P2 TaxID=3230849 RepID=A0AAU8EHJ6_9VIRU